MKAMVLAAGLGTRLRPFSNKLPKPLFPIVDQAAIAWVLKRLKKAGIENVVVNIHYLGHLLKEYLTSQPYFPDLEISEETELLGTGGGIKRVQDFFDTDKPFLLHNSDSFIEKDLSPLLNYNWSPDIGAILLVTKDPTRPKEHVIGTTNTKEGLQVITIGRDKEAQDWYLYTGIALISPRIFDFLPEGKSCLVKNGLIPMLQANIPIMAVELKGKFIDIGTPTGLLKANKLALKHSIIKSNVPPDVKIIHPVFIDQDVKFSGQPITIGPYAFLNKEVLIKGPITISNTVVLPRSIVDTSPEQPLYGS